MFSIAAVIDELLCCKCSDIVTIRSSISLMLRVAVESSTFCWIMEKKVEMDSPKDFSISTFVDAMRVTSDSVRSRSSQSHRRSNKKSKSYVAAVSVASASRKMASIAWVDGAASLRVGGGPESTEEESSVARGLKVLRVGTAFVAIAGTVAFRGLFVA
jgi:hypothetical protein